MKKGKNTIILVCFTLIILSITLTVLILHNSPPDNGNNGIVYDPNSTVNVPQDDIKLPGIAIPGWTTIVLPADTLEADVSLHNPQANEGYYDLTFTLKFKDSEEIIFTTGYIEPGFKCNKVTLSQKLKKGKYDAILVVQPYTKESTKKPTNNAELDVQLVVK